MHSADARLLVVDDNTQLLGAEGTIRKPFESGQLLQLVRGMFGDPASIKVVPPAGR